MNQRTNVWKQHIYRSKGLQYIEHPELKNHYKSSNRSKHISLKNWTL